MQVRTQIIPDPSNPAFTWACYYCSDDCVEQAWEAQDVTYTGVDVTPYCDYCDEPIKEAA